MENSTKNVKSGHIVSWMLFFSLAVSLTALVVYLMDINYNDNILNFLLTVLRYSSYTICTLSLYKFLFNLFYFFRRPSVSYAFKIVLSLVFIAYGLIIIFLETIISVIAGGNV
jgi:hypothetical protein